MKINLSKITNELEKMSNSFTATLVGQQIVVRNVSGGGWNDIERSARDFSAITKLVAAIQYERGTITLSAN